jgi:predicted CoA-binding protein
MPSLEQQKRVIESYAKKYKSIAIVAHSECIKRYAGYKIANCQVFPFSIANL